MTRSNTEERKLAEWWDRLTTVARKAVLRKQARREEKAVRRAAPVQLGASGYCCPKCHTWHPTPEARAACRTSHTRRP